jgi:hypothetical protein
MLLIAYALFTMTGRVGRSIRVIPSEPDPHLGFTPLPGYPNPFISLPSLSPLPVRGPTAPDCVITRNYINVLTRDADVNPGLRVRAKIYLHVRKSDIML